jgi:hypothetical protein
MQINGKIAVHQDSEDLRRQYSEQSQLGMEKFALAEILDAWHTLLERM